jgi:hypothetical protein
MSARQADDTILVGPIVVDAVDDDVWGFVLIRGRSGVAAGAGADILSATSPLLLETARQALLLTMQAADWITTLECYDDEMALARAAAERWPAKFESLVALGEVVEAGGGRA